MMTGARNYELTREEYISGISFSHLSRGRFLLMLLGGLAAGFIAMAAGQAVLSDGRPFRGWSDVVFIVVLMAFIMLVLPHALGRMQFDGYRALYGATELRWDRAGINATTPRGIGHHLWSDFRAATTNKLTMALHLRNQTRFIIPKRILSEADIAEIRGYVRAEGGRV